MPITLCAVSEIIISIILAIVNAIDCEPLVEIQSNDPCGIRILSF